MILVTHVARGKVVTAVEGHLYFFYKHLQSTDDGSAVAAKQSLTSGKLKQWRLAFRSREAMSLKVIQWQLKPGIFF